MDAPLPTPSDIETLAKTAGLSIAEVCRKAGIASSTFSRWKAGTTSPTLTICKRLLDAVRVSA